MIVFHDFFYKAHPHYLDRAVDMMRKINECGLILHYDLSVFINNLKILLKEDGGGRLEKGIIGLSVVEHQIQIEVKGGMDYAARICYFQLKNAKTISVDGHVSQEWVFDPLGKLKPIMIEGVYENKRD